MPTDGPRTAEESQPTSSDPADWFVPADDIDTPIYDQLVAELPEARPPADGPSAETASGTP